MCVLVCVWGGGGVGLLPNNWNATGVMDVLLREHEVYVDTVKLITNIKIYQKKKNIYIKPYFKTTLKIFYFNW